MENPFSNTQQKTFQAQQLSEERARVFMRQVYMTMALGLAITGLTAWFVSQNLALMQFFFSGFMRYIVMFAPLGIVIFLAARVQKMSFNQASLAFAVYSLVNGISFATIFFVYDLGAIYRVFLITAGTFGAMALIGMTTKADLSKMGSILYMALIGLIIAMLVNFFMQSSMFDYIISILGVLIFCGLTAYDNQKLMRIGSQIEVETDGTRKI
ncbi:MAG: Bax inhibitor-1/YccA family protein, partial [Bacteroidota bacterium]